ncbi:hypothetical protein F4861DRAFT_520751 [Xylaria intraflava]|nr:hypothetical protein F4861DRAFT_520751 [Xylaria intraflava]
MPSLRSQHPLWTSNLAALSADEIAGHMVEARHVVGLLQGELNRRAVQGSNVEEIDKRLESTVKRLSQKGLQGPDEQRLADLVEDRQNIHAISDQTKPTIQNLLTFVWLTDQLTTSAHTALLYIAFSKSSLIRATIDEKSTMIRVLRDRNDLVSNMVLNRVQPQSMPSEDLKSNTLQDDESWIDMVISEENDIGTMLKILVLWGGKGIPSYLITSGNVVGEPLQMEPPPILEGTCTPKECLLELSKHRAINISIDSSLEESYTVSDAIQQRIEALGVTNSLKTFALTVLINRLRITVGVAIIAHTQGDEKASIRWEEVRDACRSSDWKEGYGDMIINLSLSEIAYRSGNNDEGDALLQEAIRIYQETGQQYYTGHGTTWPTKVLVWLSSWFSTHPNKKRRALRTEFGYT